MRLFIAINLSDETRGTLSAFRDTLRPLSESGTFSLTENLHLTLAFLGSCDHRQASAARRVVNATRFEPFTITIAGGGYLDKGRPNLVFCGLQNDDGYRSLLQLQSNLTDNLAAKGFQLEQRKFWPHITLGRKVVWRDTGRFSSFMDLQFPVLREGVSSIALMRSEHIGDKLTYTCLFRKEAE